jgi:hypothetical protein
VLRAQEVNSWALDIFNPGARQLIVKSPGNHITTLLPRLKTSNAHGFTPNNPQARALLKTEIERAIG